MAKKEHSSQSGTFEMMTYLETTTQSLEERLDTISRKLDSSISSGEATLKKVSEAATSKEKEPYDYSCDILNINTKLSHISEYLENSFIAKTIHIDKPEIIKVPAELHPHDRELLKELNRNYAGSQKQPYDRFRVFICAAIGILISLTIIAIICIINDEPRAWGERAYVVARQLNIENPASCFELARNKYLFDEHKAEVRNWVTTKERLYKKTIRPYENIIRKKLGLHGFVITNVIREGSEALITLRLPDSKPGYVVIIDKEEILYTAKADIHSIKEAHVMFKEKIWRKESLSEIFSTLPSQ